jgi:hypothetical protein
MNKMEIIRVRVEPEERQGFKLAADAVGISLSAWIRQHLRTAARRQLEELGEKVPFARSRERE